MPWATFDDHFGESEGALNAGVEACGLHLLASCWCAAHLSDGKLPAIVAKRLISGCLDDHGAEIVARLMEAGLWERQEDGGYVLLDFLTTNGNRTRAQVEANRGDKKAAGRKGGLAKASSRRSRPKAPTEVPEPEPEQDTDFLPF